MTAAAVGVSAIAWVAKLAERDGSVDPSVDSQPATNKSSKAAPMIPHLAPLRPVPESILIIERSDPVARGWQSR